MGSAGGRPGDRPPAVLQKGRAFERGRRDEIALVLVLLQGMSFEEGDDLVENASIAGDLDVLGGREGKPEEIVGDAGPHAGAGLGVPPVLHVALAELTGSGYDDLLASNRRRGVEQG